ncbi:hypothetical protein ALQ93_102449 [Pseudomonas syringae pv. pisi]|uniref:Uncharacterized protein n=3 Tax=Pseudomonas syringae group TaxID=136849 RepID=A0A3M3CN68_PSESJ|nr:hypothetical protein ALO75_102808 [Pseudomonas syringae pv. coryli]RML50664.1 hypothetical protein ALQ93_102449 [Pseudomonas syringae pv. pisi]RMU88378.1 hypothetical protein ALP21_102127 [Pseudomonas savastanoi pv. phaseolicola]RML59889.1 hypothetical protein ALQ92_102060 [Pseudomonas syringae pv. pisi]RMM26337.1 hypothetical protein ALQ82_102036 [Pseudomonas syringae pv. pisi]
MRTSLCKALLPRNCPKMAGSDGCLFLRQIAINAGPIGLRDQVKNPAFCQAQATSAKGKINPRIQRHPPCHADQSVKTEGHVLHHHPPASDPRRQWSIFFN